LAIPAAGCSAVEAAGTVLVPLSAIGADGVESSAPVAAAELTGASSRVNARLTPLSAGVTVNAVKMTAINAGTERGWLVEGLEDVMHHRASFISDFLLMRALCLLPEGISNIYTIPFDGGQLVQSPLAAKSRPHDNSCSSYVKSLHLRRGGWVVGRGKESVDLALRAGAPQPPAKFL
jgi:hypothetical protein